MSLESLINSKKLQLKSCKTIVTNTLGEKYEEVDGARKQLPAGIPFVIDDKPDLEVSEIVSGLFLSSQDPAVNLEILREYKIHHILSIGIDVMIKFDDINYYYCDLLDLPESDLVVTIKKCVKIIHKNRRENILVHCNAGVSRSPSIVISYLMAFEGLSYDNAYEKVKRSRSCIRPNEGFVMQLKTLELSSILQ